MPVCIERSLHSLCAPTEAWAYLVDYRHVPDWLFGVARFTPVGDQVTGVGATFDAAMSLGVTIRSRVAVVEWSEGQSLAFESIKGFKNTAFWRLTPADDGGTRFALRVTYDLPLGPAGKAVGRTIEPFITAATSRSMHSFQSRLAEVATRRA